MKKEKPYISKVKKVVEHFYNPKYGDSRICMCGHPYHRHFDSYENMDAVGCKYCPCYGFKEAPAMAKVKNTDGKSKEELLNEYHDNLEIEFMKKNRDAY